MSDLKQFTGDLDLTDNMPANENIEEGMHNLTCVEESIVEQSITNNQEKYGSYLTKQVFKFKIGDTNMKTKFEYVIGSENQAGSQAWASVNIKKMSTLFEAAGLDRKSFFDSMQTDYLVGKQVSAEIEHDGSYFNIVDKDFKTFEKAINGTGEVKQAVVEPEPKKEENKSPNVVDDDELQDDEIPF